MDLFEDENDYFGFNEYAIPREVWDVDCDALYECDVFSSIESHSEDISLEQNTKYGLQCPITYSNALYGDSTVSFLVRDETIGYKEPIVDPATDPLECSQWAAIDQSLPRLTTPEMPCSVMPEHAYSNLFPDKVPVTVMSDMFQLPGFLEADVQSAEFEKINTVQREQDKNKNNSKKSQGKSSDNMHSQDFMDLYSIRRPSGRKDRHIKVVTSRGPRDTRMRLAVETAINFFGVQDRLGFDQPSTALEWLFKKSRSAIDQLPAVFPSPLGRSSHLNTNSHSLLACLDPDTGRGRADFVTGSEEKVGEAEALSPCLLTEPSIVKQQSRIQRKRENPRKTSVKLVAVKTAGRCRHNGNKLKDIRFKARERARERTREKRRNRESTTSASPNMKHTAALEIEASNLQENTPSASSENGLNSLETSVSNLYCIGSAFKSGVLETSPHWVFCHHGLSLPAQDSVEVLAENSHLSGHSNLYFDHSRSQIQCLGQMVAQCYNDQPEDRSMQSTGPFSGLCSTTFPGPPCLFPQAVPPLNSDFRSN